MIDRVIRITTIQQPGMSSENYDAEVLGEIEAQARLAAAQLGRDVVRLEVFHPGETVKHNSWDALEVDVSGPEATFITLPPYAEQEP